MKIKLFLQAIIKYAFGVFIVGGLLFIPMYAATILLFLTIPLVLGSIISFIIFLIYPIIIGKRIKNEEKVLEKDLKGYTEYKKKIKYKVIPFVW